MQKMSIQVKQISVNNCICRGLGVLTLLIKHIWTLRISKPREVIRLQIRLTFLLRLLPLRVIAVVPLPQHIPSITVFHTNSLHALHYILLLLSKCSTLVVSPMCSFLILSFLITPNENLSFNFATISKPYIIAGLTVYSNIVKLEKNNGVVEAGCVAGRSRIKTQDSKDSGGKLKRSFIAELKLTTK